jgi:hypothetical protein
MTTTNTTYPSTLQSVWVTGSVLRAFLKNIEVCKYNDLTINIVHTGHNLVLTHALYRAVSLTVRNAGEPWSGSISASKLLNLIQGDALKREVAIGKEGIRYFQAGQWWDIEMQEFDPEVEERNREYTTLGKAIWTEAFIEKMRTAQRFQSDDETLPVLQGVSVQDENLVATDGRVMFVSPGNNTMLTTHIIVGRIPKVAGNALISIGNSGEDPEDKIPTRIQWLFWIEKAALSITDKLVEGNFPNWKQVVPRPPVDPVKVILPPSFGDILAMGKGEKHIRLFNQGETVMAQFPLKPPFTITGCHWFGEESNQWSVAFDPKFAVKAIKAGAKVIEITDALSPMVWKRLPDDGDLIVMMPKRVT